MKDINHLKFALETEPDYQFEMEEVLYYTCFLILIEMISVSKRTLSNKKKKFLKRNEGDPFTYISYSHNTMLLVQQISSLVQVFISAWWLNTLFRARSTRWDLSFNPDISVMNFSTKDYVVVVRTILLDKYVEHHIYVSILEDQKQGILLNEFT